MEKLRPSRRELLIALVLGAMSPIKTISEPRKARKRPPLCIFSKHLQWLNWDEMAKTAAELGFDGVDLTVRPGGHVLPDRVEEDLPRAVEAIDKMGLSTPMITTSIRDTGSAHAESILKTAGSLEIPYYRWGGFDLDIHKSIPEQLKQLRTRVKELAAMNREHRVCAMYHTHSGAGRIGASIWDLWLLLEDRDPNWIGVNFDIGHATVEGGLGGWIHSAHLVAPYIQGVAIKDFTWQRGNSEWEPQWCPLGEGMVRFEEFFQMLKQQNFVGPMQLHFEYPLGGADSGQRSLSVKKETVLAAMKRDVQKLKGWLRDTDLV